VTGFQVMRKIQGLESTVNIWERGSKNTDHKVKINTGSLIEGKERLLRAVMSLTQPMMIFGKFNCL
jgi:hypothetical protein